MINLIIKHKIIKLKIILYCNIIDKNIKLKYYYI